MNRITAWRHRRRISETGQPEMAAITMKGFEMKDYSRTDDVAAEMERLLAEEPESEIVAEARKRAEAITANPPYPGYQGSVRTELCFLLWQRAGMPMHPSEGGKVIVAPADFPYLPDDIMGKIDISYPSIRRLAAEMEAAGCAKKIGNRWFFSEAAFEWLRHRPDKAKREIKILRGFTPEGGKLAE